MVQGTVLWFCANRGYGFIRPDRGDYAGSNGEREIFLHANALEQAGLPALAEGDRVVFDVTLSGDGSPFATNVKKP